MLVADPHRSLSMTRSRLDAPNDREGRTERCRGENICTRRVLGFSTIVQRLQPVVPLLSVAARVCVAVLSMTPRADAQPRDPESGRQAARAPVGQDQAQTDKKPKKKKGAKQRVADEEGRSSESAKPAKHPSVTLGPVKLDFKGRIESEMRAPVPAMGLDRGQIDWQDRRLGFEGSAFKRFSFEVSRELSQDLEAARDLSERTAWKDVYVDTRLTKALRVQAGRFKLPLSHEELVGEPNLDFVRRSLAARVLAPGRDAGVMVHGRVFDRRVEYQAGYFTRDGDNGRTSQTQSGQDAVAARLVIAPFAQTPAHLLGSLQVGVAVAESRMDNRLGLRGRTVLGDGIFFDRLYVNGERRRIGLEAAWESGPASITGEYITVSDERKAMGFAGDDLPAVTANAWYIAGTWALTGERKHGRLEPLHDVLRGGLGAFEVTMRVEALSFLPALYPGESFGFPNADKLLGNADRVTTLGVN